MATSSWFDADYGLKNSADYLVPRDVVPYQANSHAPRLSDHAGLISSVYPRRKSRVTPEIVASILEVCLEETKKTRIMYRAHLTTRSLHAYLESLVRLGLLEETGSYRTTEKGRTYLELFRCIESLAGECNAPKPVIESPMMSGIASKRSQSISA